MKTFLALMVLAAASMFLWYLPEGRQAQTVQAAESGRVAFLIRFGIDGVKDADWSGSISPAPLRLSGWQFDSADQASAGAWKCATREERYWDTPYERNMGPTANRVKVTAKGILVEFDAGAVAEIEIHTAQGRFSFQPDASLWSSPRKFLGGRAEVAAAPAAALLTTGPDAEDYPSLVEGRDGTLWMAYQTYAENGDQIYVRKRASGAWSQPEALAEADGDYFRTALAEDGAGRVWVVWSAQQAGNFDLYARVFDGKQWSATERLTTAPGSDINHALQRSSDGKLYLAWQSARSGNFDIYARIHDGKRWSDDIRISSDPANDWEPALAAAADGRLTVLWDTYAKGNYDVVSRTWRGGSLGPLTAIADSGAFESRVSAQYDPQNRLWMAWDQGDWNWGKDYGNGIPESGRGLLVKRQTRVAVWENGKLSQPASPIEEAVPTELRQVFHQPRLVLDGRGNPWIFFRYRVNLPQLRGAGDAQRGSWRAGAVGFRNGRWGAMVEFPEGWGRIDAPMAVVAGRDGNLLTAWTTDGRQWPAGALRDQDLSFAAIPQGAASPAVPLTAFVTDTENLPPSHAAEASDVARVRAYRARSAGKNWRIVRGDIHRHTDISWDGNRDGSLHDSYRYALDAAAFDFLGVCDHQAGNMVPYNWWMIQKAADLFAISGKFAPLYSYERSLPWPNGHRNVVFAERGRPVLEISRAEQRGEEGAAKLYAYLRKLGGVTTSHTSATGAGTDFRDSDEELEPVVEIYQGYRHSYESPAGPRHPGDRERDQYKEGFVWSAWAKGIKMGVQSSSDHVSTHISYASLYVDRVERRAIVEAMKARRSFAATDNLIMDLRAGDRFMGESFASPQIPALKAYVRGTGPIARVELIKDNQIVYTAAGRGPEVSFTFTDSNRKPGESYYYLRAVQQDGQLGWSSPIWVKLKQ